MKTDRRNILIAWVAVCLLQIVVLTGCSGSQSRNSNNPPPSGPSVSSVSVVTTPNGTTELPLQGAVGLAAKVSGTGSPSTTVTWSVSGIPNGNATVGTISNGSTGVSYVAPVTLPKPAQVTVTATSTADTTKSSSISLSILGPNLTALPGSSSLPLTPIRITTSGVNPSLPLQVRFSGSSGYSLTESPIRMESDGTVIAAVPLYVDPATHKVSSGDVSVVLTQSNIQTASATLTINDLPPVNSYGVKPGEISHAMLVFQAMQIGRRLNAYQAFQGAVGNTVDSSTSQTALSSLLMKTIEARSDVDRVLLDNAVTIPAGALPDGTPLQFDATTLDFMDRVQAVFLSGTFGNLVLSTNGNAGPVPSTRARGHLLTPRGGSPQSPRKAALPRLNQSSPNNSQLTTMNQILLAMQGLAASGQLPLSTIDTVNAKNLGDGVSAIATGIGAVGGLANETFGGVAGLVSVASTVIHCWEDDGMWAFAKATGNDQVAALIAQDMDSIPRDQIYGSLKTLVTSPFLAEATAATKVASTAFDLITEGIKFYGLATGENSGSSPSEDADKTSLQIVKSDASVFAPPNQGIAEVEGTSTVTSDLGIEAPESGIELSPGPGEDLTAIADPSGNYSILVPLGVPSFNYATSTFSLVDPETQSVFSSENVDLTNAKSSTVTQIPALTGSCSDDDASSPDGDDPDCD
jgi:hypothetical protein